MADEFDPKKFLAETEPAFDPKAFLAQPVKRENTTLMDYPEIYGEMNRESREQMERGVRQLGAPTGGNLWESGKAAVKGVGNIGLGALGYVGSPIAAGIRTVIGEPGEQRFGVPKEYSEFAASLGIPGVGLPRIPGSTAPKVATKISGPSTSKIADEARLLTEGGQKTQAGLALREAATDPAAAARAAGDIEEIIPGSRPTFFQANKDYGLGQFERGVQTKAQAPFQERRAQQGVARMNALESVERPGNPEEVANHLRARMQTEDAAAEAAEQAAIARAEQQTQAAIRRAERAGQAVGGTNTPEIYGQILRRELDEANTATRTNVRTLWQSVDPEARLSVNTAPVMNAEFRIYRGEMTQAGAASLSDTERRIGEVIQQYGQVVPFREMQDLRSFVSSSMRQELRTNGQSPAYARLARLRGAIEESIVAPFEPGVPAGPGQAALSLETSERLAAATAASRQQAETFKQQPIRGVLQREGTAGPYPLTNAAVPGRIIPNGPKGYDHVNAYLRAVQDRPGGGLQEISDAIVADMRASATDAAGNIDPNRLMTWARGKQDALRAVSERDGGALVQRLQEVEDAGREVKATTTAQPKIAKEAAAQRAAVIKTENEGIFGDLMGVRDKEDISKLLGSIFGSKTPVDNARAVMARLTTPEAQDGARRAITDWITNKLVSNTAAGTTEINILRADQFQSFIGQNAAALREFGFTPEQIKTWQAIAADMRQAKMSIDATKVPGGSNTAQDLYAMKKFGLSGSKLSKILHLSGAVLGGWTSGPLGAIAGLFGAGKYTALRDAGIKSVQDLIVKGMLEPDFGRELLLRVTPQENIAFWRTAGMYGKRAVRAEALTGSRHDQSERPAVGHKYGGAIFPLSREGIQTRNKARAFEARERSSLARQSAQAKRQIKRADGGRVPYAIDSPEFKEEVARGLAKNPDTIAAAQEFFPRVPLNDKAWQQFIQDAPASINIEDRRPGYRGGLRAAHRPSALAEGGTARRKLDLRTPDTGGAYQADYGGGSFEPSRPQGTLDVQGSRVPEVSGSIPLTDNFSLRGSYQHPSLEDPRRGFSVGGDYTHRFRDGGRINDDSSKATKASVNYSKGMPKAHCSICTHWRHGKCTEVQGKIWHSMWCKLFKHARKYAEGDLVEPDPLEAELKRRNVPGGLSATAGPTVTSTTPVQDIPAPKVNAAGETLPTYVLKEAGKQLMGTPERLTHVGGDLQRRGEYAGSHEDLPSFGPPPEEMPAGLEVATGLYGFNAPFSAVRPGLGIFGGRGAKTANLEKLAEAERMLKEGVPHETIRNRTGWEFGPEGKPRFEISDAEARIRPEHPEDRIYEADAASRVSGFRPNQRMEQQLEHPAAYEAYPWLKDMRTSLDVSPTTKPAAEYAPPTKHSLRGSHGEISVNAPTYERGGVGDLFGEQKYSDVGARDMMLHEMQHAIQEAEGFAPGANPRDLRPMKYQDIERLTQNMAKREGLDWSTLTRDEKEKLERVIRHRLYKMHAGETEARNVQLRADDELRQRPSWATEDVKRENQVIAKTGRLKPGEKPFQDAKIYKSELPPEPPSPPSKPSILRSEFDRPLFDYSRMEEVPNVQQFDLPRIIPARGIPEHIMRLGDPRNMERTNAIVQMGMAHGGPEWYNTMPLRDRYIGEVGPVRGPESHRSYINYVGATSPRSPVPLNASVASYYDMLAAQGLPFPQPVFRRGNWSMPRGQLPEGYGSLAQATNARNAQMVRDQGPGGGWPSWTFFDKPKPPSFVANLLGNYRPITSDVHNVSMLDLRGPQGNRLIMPPHQYYGYIEGLQQGPKGAGQFIDLAPAQYQASGWIPWAAGYRDVGRYGEVTGGSPKKLQAYSEPFIKVVEDRVKKKARDLGWSPEQTLRAFLRKEIAIAGVPVAAIPLLQSRMGDEAQ